ncbi:hypothetical protein [Algoriphagus sp.]|uniref:hypothetical protein n=1 Tax=Algoriphagus sp. TaxID=1872435 RepID=UPI00261904CF|nr:hypothetical protein [Algoriphagus sp.]
MKKSLLTLLTLIGISFVGFSQGVQDVCSKLLEGGLYSITQMESSDNFSSDLKKYLLSEKFISDLKSGKWGGSFTLPLKNGLPLTIGASSSNEEINEFKSRVIETTEIKIEQGSYSSFYGTIPNTNLYESYIKCLELRNIMSPGLIAGSVIETDNVVIFPFYYKPLSLSDEKPTVKSFTVYPNGVLIDGILEVGQKIESLAFSVVCARPINEDIIVSIETDRGQAFAKASAKENIFSEQNLPVGTIISSFLTFEQFSKLTKNHEESGGVYTAEKSKWIPCDGRAAASSKFSRITGFSKVPDLRGVFLRGLNTFDPTSTVGEKDPLTRDPENNRGVGSFQVDTFQGHWHQMIQPYDAQGFNTYSGDGNTGVRNDIVRDPVSDGVNGTPRVSKETRPKNVAIYYYIRIN